MSLAFDGPEQLVGELLATSTSDLLSLIDTWCAEHPGCVSPLGAREVDPLDRDELEAASRENRPAFMFVDEEPLPPPHADIWVYGDPVVVRANPRATPRLRVLTDDPDAPVVFPDGSRDRLARTDQLRAATWLVRGLRDRARTYERVVREIVALRPEIATIHDPKAVSAVELADLANGCALDIETVRRSVSGLRFQTPVTVVAAVVAGDRLTFRRAIF
ncbi:hypothetical protein BH11MYX3_BH11MYX3_09990 [soil metagenome]